MDTFTVIVRDNFHYMDPSKQYDSGTFNSYGEAVAHAKQIVDDFLTLQFKAGISKEQLYELYTMFGEDPFISPDQGEPSFSAWNYAKIRCRKKCDEEWWHDE